MERLMEKYPEYVDRLKYGVIPEEVECGGNVILVCDTICI